MMQNTTEKKRAARFWGIAFMIFFALYIVLFLCLAMTEDISDSIGRVVLAVYSLVFGAIVVGVYKATRQRLAEIDGGEEEEARKY